MPEEIAEEELQGERLTKENIVRASLGEAAGT